MTSRGFSILEAQQRSVPHYSNSASFGGSQAPMNFSYLGGQQQMGGQQSGIGDAQLIQQQFMQTQIQELQRRDQLPQFEAMQRNGMNHMSTSQIQSAGQKSQATNSNPVQVTSNYPWQSQITTGGTNWLQRGYPSAVHAYSNKLMMSPEQSHSMSFLDLLPEQASHSLYGVPVLHTGGTNLFSQKDKPGIVSEGTSFEHAFSQGFEKAVNLGGVDQVQQMTDSMLDAGGRGYVGGSDVSLEKSLMQTSASQAATGLDPTEEKILFGNDGNIWEAFGGALDTDDDGADTDLFNGTHSMQSGTWSALMQSAVGETSSDEVRLQEEWSGLESQNSRSQSRNQPRPTSQDNEAPQHVWVDSSQRAALDLRTTGNDVIASNATLNTNNPYPRLQQPFLNERASPKEIQALPEGRNWLDNGSPKLQTEENRVLESSETSRNSSKIDTTFWSHCESTLPESIPDSNINAKVDSVVSSPINRNLSEESSQRPPDSHRLELWKPAMLGTKYGIVGSRNNQFNMNKGIVANNLGGGVPEMHARENGNRRDTSNDSHQNNFSNHALAGSLKENMWSDAGGQHFVPGAPGISSVYAGRRGAETCEFQNKKMGDVDEFSSAKQVSHTQSTSSSSVLKAHELQQTQLDPTGSRLPDIEKGEASGFHRGVQMLHDSFSSGAYPGHLSCTSAPFTKSSDYFSQNQHLLPSQNMLELLHKVDQSKDCNAVASLGSTNYNRSSGIPTGGLIGTCQSQSSTCHSFHLQLAPPQGYALSNLNDPAQSSSSSIGPPSSGLGPFKKEDKRIAGFGSDPFPNQYVTTAGGQITDARRSPIVSSDMHACHDQQSTHFQDQIVTNQSDSDAPNNLACEKGNNQSGMRELIQQISPSIHAAMPGMMKNNMPLVNPDLWAPQHQMLGAQARDSLSFSKPHSQSYGALGMNSFNHQKKDALDGNPKSSGRVAGVSLEESLERPLMEASPLNSNASQKDADVHHRVKPNKETHEMQLMNTMNMDPSHRDPMRLRDSENGPDASQIAGKAPEPSTSVVNSMVRDSSVISEAHLTGISQQMDPSWFEKYGTFRTGMSLPLHNVLSAPMVKNVRNSMQLEKSIIDTCQIADTSRITNMYSTSEQLSPLHPLVPHYSSPSHLPLRPKKRKTATSDLIPWNKEIGQVFKRIQNLSSAEVDWMQSSSRLVERGGDEIESHEKMSVTVRPRRRLILTTKLVQQVFCPPPASILSIDGKSNYEVVMYSIARIALGDACNLLCGMESDISSVREGSHREGKTSERIPDQYYSKVMNDFMIRAKELEKDLSRLDSHTSILDFRLDCQDLERFSIINRFARFHGRSQVDGVETASSSDRYAISLKTYQQRYVTAQPMPSTVPERVQCLAIN